MKNQPPSSTFIFIYYLSRYFFSKVIILLVGCLCLHGYVSLYTHVHNTHITVQKNVRTRIQKHVHTCVCVSECIRERFCALALSHIQKQIVTRAPAINFISLVLNFVL